MSDDTTLLDVEGTTLKFTDPTITGDITILPPPSSVVSPQVMCNGKKVYRNISFTVANATNGTVTNGTGAGIINGTATSVDINAMPPVRKLDSVDITITGVTGSTPATFGATVTTDDPGQSKSRAV